MMQASRLNARVAKACMAAEPPPVDAPDLPPIPRIRNWRLALGMLETLSPLHDPRRGRTPPWITDWFAADEAGVDMTEVSL